MKQNYFKLVSLTILMLVIGFGNAFAEDRWVKTAPTDLAKGDIVMIVDLGSKRAMSNDKGTSNPPDATRVYFINEETISTGISNNTVEVPTSLQWVVTVVEDDFGKSYKFGVSGTSNYLYCTNSNNGVRVGANSNNAFTVIVSNGKSYLKNTATSRYLGVYTTNNDWRCYTTTTSNNIDTNTAFYKKESDDVVLSSISISGYTTTFNVGDNFVFGGTVMANYENGEPKNVTNSASFTGYDMSTPGTQTVTVSYGGKTATYDITVSAIPVTGITLNTNEAEIEVGQTLQLTATIAPENATNKEYSWSSSDEDVATVDENGLVSAIAAGPAIITVTTTDGGKTATCTVTVKAKEGIWYSLVTSTDNLAEGDQVIIVNTNNKRAMSTTQNDANRKATDVNVAGGKAFVPKNGDIQVLTLEGNTDGWYFHTGSGYLYAASSTANQLKTEAEKDKNNNAKAAIMISNGATSVVFQGTNTRNVLQNNGTIFSCYGSASQAPVDIYKLDDGKQDAELSFNEETVTVNVGEIDVFVSPTFNNPNNLTVTATSTDEDVAVFDVETSEIVLNGSVGTAEITVTSTETDEYRAGVASITVTVKKADTAVFFEEAVVEITYGDNYNKQAATAEGFSGDIVYTSSDESIVKFHGNSVIDILKPGTVTITAIAPATDTTEESSATYTLKIYEPADAVVGTEELLNEPFDDCDGSNPSENIWWGSGSSYKALPERLQLLGWTTSNNTPAGKGCLKVGNTGGGTATSPSFTLDGTTSLSFDIAPWLSASDFGIENGTITVTLTNATFNGSSNSISFNTRDALIARQFTNKQYEITGTGENVTITFSGDARFFLDNVVVGGGAQPAHEINLTFSSAGYLTWVATADIDFSQTADVTAYQITEATSQKITMEEVDKVPAGAAVMLKGSGTKTLKRTTEEVADLSDNKMLACTDGSVTGNGVNGVTNTDVYVLGNGKSGLGFYMLKGTLQAGKGYLQVSEGTGNAKPNFISFEETTGVKTVVINKDSDGEVYNLQGIRVAHPQKGIYVKNGKKYVIK